MADKPKDNRPATEFGEVKVIKNELEAPLPEPGEKPRKAEPAETPEGAEG